jgi:hypothetical protein
MADVLSRPVDLFRIHTVILKNGKHTSTGVHAGTAKEGQQLLPMGQWWS